MKTASHTTYRRC